MRTLTACIAVAFVAIGLSVLVAGDAAEQKTVQRRRPVVKQHRRPVVATKTLLRKSEEKPLGKTVRLTFTVTTGDGDHSFPVLCAARDFLINHNVAEANGGHELKFAGSLTAVDQQDRVFLSFDVFRADSNDVEGLDATFKLQGSAVLRFEQKTELGKLGEDKVTLTASVVD